ncbi:MAG: multiheme c-type cytochrome [Fimbriimonas sp.]
MKIWALAFGAVGVGGALLPAPEAPWTLVVAGDADGYLSPCGCTAPMVGGLRRRATAIRAAGPHTHIVAIDTGGLGGTPGRQGELKAETAAQVAVSLNAAAIHLTERDAALGVNSVASVAQLAEGRLVSTSLPPGSVENVVPYTERGPFLIGGASAYTQALGGPLGVTALTPTQAARSLVTAAQSRKRTSVLMLSGDRKLAVAIAQAVPGLAAVVYRSSGDPPNRMDRVGNTVLLSPGERGKHVVRVNFDGKEFAGYAPIRLGPGYADDKDASRIYSAYLRRVGRANLLDALPRSPSDPFTGTEACGTCHQKAHDIWKRSKHAGALHTLEHDGHDRDPDCVGCHVVGLDKVGGFTSRAATPHLTDVGCESCHGAGGKHASAPTTFRMPKVTELSCAPCHRPENSPNFNFLTYWKKIAH